MSQLQGREIPCVSRPRFLATIYVQLVSYIFFRQIDRFVKDLHHVTRTVKYALDFNAVVNPEVEDVVVLIWKLPHSDEEVASFTSCLPVE